MDLPFSYVGKSKSIMRREYLTPLVQSLIKQLSKKIGCKNIFFHPRDLPKIIHKDTKCSLKGFKVNPRRMVGPKSG